MAHLRSLLLVGTELTPRFHFTSHACFAWQVFQGVASVALIVPVDIILIMRSASCFSALNWQCLRISAAPRSLRFIRAQQKDCGHPDMPLPPRNCHDVGKFEPCAPRHHVQQHLPSPRRSQHSPHIWVSFVPTPPTNSRAHQATVAIIVCRAASVVFQIGLFILTLVKFIAALRSRARETTIVSLLMRDGTWAFALIFRKSTRDL